MSVLRRRHRRGELLGKLVHADAALPREPLLLLEKELGEPFIVARRGRAALLDEVEAGKAEERVHHDGLVQHGRSGDVLVDAPGARDDAEILLVGHVHRDGAGIDVEHAACHRCPAASPVACAATGEMTPQRSVE